MRIALIEPFHHQEIIYRWLELLTDPPVSWTVFATNSIRKQAPDHVREQGNVNWITWTEHTSAWDTVVREDALLQAQEAVILLTTGLDYHIWSKLTVRPPLIVVNHNTSALLRHPSKGGEGVGNAPLARIRKLRYDLLGRDKHRLRLLNRTAALAFPTAYTKMYAEKLGPMPTGIILPFGYYQPKDQIKTTAKGLRVGIPVSCLERESYRTVRTLLQAVEKSLQTALTIQILGIDEQERLNRKLSKALTTEAIQIDSYTETLDQARYDTLLGQLDFLLLPIAKFQYFGPFRERMGLTKISGSLFDMIYYNCPALIPEHYPLPKATEALVQRYQNTKELQAVFLQWVNDRSFEARRQNAQRAMEALNAEAVRQQLRKNLIQIIDG